MFARRGGGSNPKRGTSIPIAIVSVTGPGGRTATVRDAELRPPKPRIHIMAMPVSLRRYTLEDLDRFPDDGNRYELLDGVLFVTPAPLPAHEVIRQRLILAIGNHIRPWPDLWLAPRSEVVLPPSNKLEPDLQVYRAAMVPRRWTEVSDRWLAVEVASRSTRVYDREHKLQAYLDLGVREVWLVDRLDDVVRVASQGQPAERTVATELIWSPPSPVGPLEIDLVEQFRGLPSDW
jgi:Uma2 family endonuclease